MTETLQGEVEPGPGLRSGQAWADQGDAMLIDHPDTLQAPAEGA